MDAPVDIIADPGFGLVRMFVWPDGSESGTDDEQLAAFTARVQGLAKGIGGSAVVERASPELKGRVSVWGDSPEGVHIMTRIKQRFDPMGILNPGRFVGGYMMAGGATSGQADAHLHGGSVTPVSGFIGVDAPAEADMYRCVHCGLCISACPTYGELSLEAESPRGRIALMKAVNEGRLAINPRVVSHWDMCLQCRACEAVCPSGVPYGRIMANTRAQVAAQDQRPAKQRWVSRLFLRGALPHPGRLRLGAQLARVYQKVGLQTLVRRSGVLRVLPGRVDKLEAQLPAFSGPFFKADGRTYKAVSDRKLTVGLLSGCVMPLMQGDTMRASGASAHPQRVRRGGPCRPRLLRRASTCTAGDLEYARSMARRNIDVFLAAGLDVIVTASAGCGSAMKEYDDLLKDDPRSTPNKRDGSAELTKDITELLVSLPFDPPKASVRRRVTYQDPCHLAHAQRITVGAQGYFERHSRG